MEPELTVEGLDHIFKEVNRLEEQKRQRGKVAEEFIYGVDWKLLRQQYEHLVDVVDYYKLTSGEGYIQEMGLINLLEALKDLAVDHFGLDYETVYGFPRPEGS